ncbi:MAG: Flp family type IVb pilin [Phascolarctobacterium sp.]
MFLRKLGKRGVAMTEYAVLLAFIAGIGGAFASDNGLGQSIINAITGAKTAIEDAGSGQATGKHALLGKDIAKDRLTALDYQTSIPYDFISAKLGEGKQLEAIEFTNGGVLQNIWYSENGELKALDAATVNAYNGKWESGSDSVQGEFYRVWNDSTLEYTDFQKYKANINSGSTMFAAYDKYGNVVQKVNTSGLTGDAVSAVQDRTTYIGMKGGSEGTVWYDFNDTDGFYAKQNP